ncbi:hypothetical protein L9F63_017044, partial [Diploptera punctata]
FIPILKHHCSYRAILSSKCVLLKSNESSPKLENAFFSNTHWKTPLQTPFFQNYQDISIVLPSY